jgi:hypothetical protein
VPFGWFADIEETALTFPQSRPMLIFEMEPFAIDPSVELIGAELRHAVIAMLDGGRISLPTYAKGRMDQRHVTAPQIEAALRSGALSTESCDTGTWRYRATRQNVVVIFTFDVDDEGNLLIVVTTWRQR